MKRKLLTAVTATVCTVCCTLGVAACTNSQPSVGSGKVKDFIRVTDGVFSSAGYVKANAKTASPKSAAFDTSAGAGVDLGELYGELEAGGNSTPMGGKLNHIKCDTLYQGANLAGLFLSLAEVIGDGVFKGSYDLTALDMAGSVAKLEAGDYYTLYGVMRSGAANSSSMRMDFREYASGKFEFKLAQYTKTESSSELRFSYYDSASAAFSATLTGGAGVDFTNYDVNYDNFTVTSCTIAVFGNDDYISGCADGAAADENILKFAKRELGYNNQTYIELANAEGGDTLGETQAAEIYNCMAKHVYRNPYSPDDPSPTDPVEIERITITESMEIRVGESKSVTLTIAPSNANDYKLSWSSSDEAVATVNYGEVRAIAEGTATITVTTDNGRSAACKVTVVKGDQQPSDKDEVESITIAPPPEITVGDELQLHADIFPAHANAEIGWKSSDESVLAVDNNGYARAIAAGKVTITASAGGKSDSVTVTVMDEPIRVEHITLNTPYATLEKGETVELSANITPSDAAEYYTVQWTSTDDKVATVDENGNVTAVSVGAATIKATAGGVSASCRITVNPVRIQSVAISPREIAIRGGETAKLELTIQPANAEPAVQWSSSDPSVATVDEKGKITAVAGGTATVTASVNDGAFMVTCSVTITDFAYIAISENGETVAYEVKAGIVTDTEITIPSTHDGKPVTKIADYAFSDKTAITKLTIPSSVKEIGKTAFFKCSGLKEITLPVGLKKIGADAFNSCPAITQITIPEGVENIGASSFAYCTGLTQITVPDSVIEIGAGAFSNCSNLAKMTLPFVGASKKPTNTYEGRFEFVFSGSSSTTNKYLPESLREITITGGVVGSFGGCGMLTKITLREGVTAIGASAFADCAGITEMTVPDSVTSVGKSAFKNCTNLESLSLPFVGETKEATGINARFGYAFGAEYNYDNATYVPQSLTKVVVRGGNIAENAFINCSSLAEITLGEGVTAIGASAFANCAALTEMTVPNGVTSIGAKAFENCDGLTKITLPFVGNPTDNTTNCNRFGYIFGGTSISNDIPANLKEVCVTGSSVIKTGAFESCITLTKIVLCDGVTSIESNAFSGCTGLTELTIPSSVTSIGLSAFTNCSGLTKIILPYGVTTIRDSAFSNCTALTEAVIPDSVTSIGLGVFSGCESLASLTIPFLGTSVKDSASKHFGYIFGAMNISDNQTRVPATLKELTVNGGDISDSAFVYCTNLKSVALKVSSIAVNAFNGCTGLESVEILGGVASIGEDAFRDCTSLKRLTLPDSVKTIGNYAFYGCVALNSLTINAEDIGGYAFYGCTSLAEVTITNAAVTFGANAFGECSGLTTLNLPQGLTSIGGFGGCTALTGLKLPDSLKIIQAEAFLCYGGTNINFPDGLTEIGESAFKESKLTSVVIPDSVTVLGNDAFKSCAALTSLKIGKGVAAIGENAFYECSNLTQVIISVGVTTVGNRAFNFCSKLQSVYYEGASADWLNIKIGVDNSLRNATRYYYSETKPQGDSEYTYWHYAEDGVTPVIWD